MRGWMHRLSNLMDECAATLQLFDAFGQTWNDPRECLQYLDEWLPALAYVLHVSSAHQVLVEENDEFRSWVCGSPKSHPRGSGNEAGRTSDRECLSRTRRSRFHSKNAVAELPRSNSTSGRHEHLRGTRIAATDRRWSDLMIPTSVLFSIVFTEPRAGIGSSPRATPRVVMRIHFGTDAPRTTTALAHDFKDVYISISAAQGRFLYLVARSIGANLRRSCSYKSLSAAERYPTALVRERGLTGVRFAAPPGGRCRGPEHRSP